MIKKNEKIKNDDEWKKKEKKEWGSRVKTPKRGSLEQKKKFSKHTFEGVKNWNAASKVF